MMIEGGVNAPAFETYVEQILAPSLQPGQMVVMDNLYQVACRGRILTGVVSR